MEGLISPQDAVILSGIFVTLLYQLPIIPATFLKSTKNKCKFLKDY